LVSAQITLRIFSESLNFTTIDFSFILPEVPEVQEAVTEAIVPKEELKLSPIQSADKRKARGNDSFKKSQYTDAIQFYLEAIDLYPEAK